ncbi:MAG: tRNA (N(6)-L-threonylcarbamoyladenosine(37)-C(2))-methylthiotransferase MtaB [Gammaproteobacteria bacterium]|nr:tRNA (N(6)-L-threonylcarbamoyladenosine(37)-C(2))-methylthiotransferase MtaB [Gammaproteobacteria bacterium]
MKTVAFKTLGCRLNEAEIETWAREFQATGFNLSTDPESADLLVVNTCAVTQEATRKSRKLIRQTQRKNPNAKLVISGCYSSLESEQAKQLEGVDLVVHNSDKNKLVQLVNEQLDFSNMPVAAEETATESSLFSRGRHRAFVKIQDGCRYRCTYCIVTLARGEEQSRSIKDITDEINCHVNEGIKEVVLTGVHVGGYGSDNRSSLYELIRCILEDTDLPRLRLASVEPWDLADNFPTLFENKRLMPHMHLPLQSGSDSVLRRMSRRCKTDEFRTLVNHLKTAIPGFSITTDIIVGFPGETELEWSQGLEFIESINFAHTHIFSYSRREGTKAATLPNQVDTAIKKQRSQTLHQLAKTMKRNAYTASLNEPMNVLWEKASHKPDCDDVFYSGYTDNYLRIKINAEPTICLENQIKQVVATAISDDGEYLVTPAL